jgi:hypothetical protein
MGMRQLALLLVLLPLGGHSYAAASQAFHVSPNGDDAGPGTAEKPFRTFERARDGVRPLLAETNDDIVVYFHAGEYTLDRPILLGPEDSGPDGHTVIYRNAPGEEPVFSGGRRLTAWRQAGPGVYRAATGGLDLRQLYVNGRKMTRARHPNRDAWLRLPAWDLTNRVFRFSADSFGAWTDLKDGEIVLQRAFQVNHLRLATLRREGNQMIAMAMEPERTHAHESNKHTHLPNQAFFLEGCREFLDEPREWWLDRAAGEVYFRTGHGDDPCKAPVVAPALEELLVVSGRTAGDAQTPRLAHHIRFEGLTFAYATWMRPSREGFMDIQAGQFITGDTWCEEGMPAAVRVQDAENIVFHRCVFRCLGAEALALTRNTANCVIEGNVFHDIAGNAISLNRLCRPQAVCRNDTVRNNLVTRVAQEFLGSVGIFASYVDGARIEHNEVFDLPYSGISVGWGWTHDDTTLRANSIRWNHVHHVGQIICDCAAIYTLSRQSGTIIAQNHLHSLHVSPWAHDWPLVGIYLDGGTSGVTVEDNVLWDMETPFYAQRFDPVARDNVVRRNETIRADIIRQAGLEPAFVDVVSRLGAE